MVTDPRPIVRVVTAAYPSPADPRRAHFIEDLHLALRDRFRFEVLCPRVHAADPRVEERGDALVTRFTYRSKGRRPKEGRFGLRAMVSYVRSARRAARELWGKDSRRGAVVGHWVVPTGWIATRVGASLGLPVLTHAHGSDLHRYGRRGIGRVLAKRTLSRADRVLASSASLVQRAEGLGATGVVEMPVGVEREFFDARARGSRTEDYSTRTTRRLALYVGDFVRSKGVDRVVEFARNLRASGEDVRVEAWGSGPLEEELVTAGVDVRGTGNAAEIADAMHRSDVLLLPSDDEGAALVVREAIAIGLPVAATAVGSVPDLFRDRSGWIELPAHRDANDYSILEPLFLRPATLDDVRVGMRRDFEGQTEALSIDSVAERFGAELDLLIESGRGA